MFSNIGILQKVFFGIFISCLLLLLVFHFTGYDASIPWQILAEAHSENFIPYHIQKGPFQFDLQGYYYSIAEVFSADPIQRNYSLDGFFLVLIFFGFNTILAVATTMPRYWFIGIAGAFTFFLFSLRLNELGVFGFLPSQQYGTFLLFVLYLVPAYLFHAFGNVSLVLRIIALQVVGVLLYFFAGIEQTVFIDHLISNGYASLVILCLIFLVIVAEEIIFGMLYLITRVKGGTNNDRHFILFGFCYLLIVGAYYGKKAGLIPLEITFFDPYILLMISSLIAGWSLSFKHSYIERMIGLPEARVFFCAIGLVTFSFLAQSMFRGNDPVYEGFHYFILYIHLAFGAFFFFYIILNFINPLSQGLQVFKIVYRSQNFPYISARLAGLAAIAAFFFLADKAPYLLFQSGYYNYLGAEARTGGDENLAIRYFEEGRIYGHDNHFSNYQLGQHHLKRNELELSNHRFYRATLRYPSAQAFINQSRTDILLGNTTPAIVDLKTGLLSFPHNGFLNNNLGLLFAQLGSLDSAKKFLDNNDQTGSWNNANQTNYWLVKTAFDQQEAGEEYKTGNLSVKANILARSLKDQQPLVLSLDTFAIKSSTLSLHKGAYLVNYAWINKDDSNTPLLLDALSSPMNDELFRSAKQAVALSAYLNGQVNLSFSIYDEMIHQSARHWQGVFHNQKGLLALDQHAPALAEIEFNLAIEYGEEEARLNLIATFLELEEWGKAYELMDKYTEDDFYPSLKKDFQRIQSGKGLSEEEIKVFAYYFYEAIELDDLSQILNKCDTSFIQSLWTKIKVEQLNESPNKLSAYLTQFNKYLDPSEVDQTDQIIRLLTGVSLSKEQLDLLKTFVDQNSLHATLVIAVAKKMSSSENMDSYNLLLEAMNMNQNHVGLIKAYIEECIQQGLLNYAESTLEKLEPLITEKEFLSYSEQINSKIAEIRAQGFF